MAVGDKYGVDSDEEHVVVSTKMIMMLIPVTVVIIVSMAINHYQVCWYRLS